LSGIILAPQRWPRSPPTCPHHRRRRRSIRSDSNRARALAALAPHLPPHLLADAPPPLGQSALAALAALAPHLPPHLLADALTAARTIRSDRNRATALAALAPHLPAEQQPAVYADALAAARTIADDAD
jgi:hypothetical protein